MTPFFEILFDEILLKEGGYSNHPYDYGGKTKYGITQQTARDYGYNADMKDLSLQLAKDIYYKRYFVAPGFDRVAVLSEKIAKELFDTGVNMGVGRAAAFLQQSLNVLNRMQKDYADIKEDRDIGGGTIAALDKFLKLRGKEGEAVMLRCLNGLQFAHYFLLATNQKTQEDFMYGWVRSRIS